MRDMPPSTIYLCPRCNVQAVVEPVTMPGGKRAQALTCPTCHTTLGFAFDHRPASESSE